ncbi:hypothetical protein GQ44DRAFT_244798 [Phaeosphaeriaceae sp. PMI808]|nr:hypothetical protein GQ44DRAFT_244798 [Phaeosphaeriaceae sp. PMI808]
MQATKRVASAGRSDFLYCQRMLARRHNIASSHSHFDRGGLAHFTPSCTLPRRPPSQPIAGNHNASTTSVFFPRFVAARLSQFQTAPCPGSFAFSAHSSRKRCCSDATSSLRSFQETCLDRLQREDYSAHACTHPCILYPLDSTSSKADWSTSTRSWSQSTRIAALKLSSSSAISRIHSGSS